MIHHRLFLIREDRMTEVDIDHETMNNATSPKDVNKRARFDPCILQDCTRKSQPLKALVIDFIKRHT